MNRLVEYDIHFSLNLKDDLAKCIKYQSGNEISNETYILTSALHLYDLQIQ